MLERTAFLAHTRLGKARYTQVVTVSGTGKMIFVAGQLARNAQGVCVGKGNMRAQIHPMEELELQGCPI